MSLTDPILVEVLRGDSVECVHRGALVVLDAAGRVVFSVGDIEQAIYPRSAIKALQALPLVESGAADRYGFGHAELALACSSHSGEPRHAETAAAMLAKAGLTEATLECGAHWPSGASATQGLARSGGKPSALHNNCSGKHSGFVCFACQRGSTRPAMSASTTRSSASSPRRWARSQAIASTARRPSASTAARSRPSPCR
jgi:L-asparaginase II